MKQKNKHSIIAGISIVLIIILVLIFGLSNRPFTISIPDFPPVEINGMWGDTPIKINSVYIGEITNAEISFCGSNDNDIELKNTYDVERDLNIDSSISSLSARSRDCAGNYIWVELQLPKGILTGDYSVSANSERGDNEQSIASIKIGELATFTASSRDPVSGIGSESFSDLFSIPILEQKTLLIKVETSKSTNGNAVASLDLNFDEGEVDCISGEYICEGNILSTCSPDGTYAEVGESPPNMAPNGTYCEDNPKPNYILFIILSILGGAGLAGGLLFLYIRGRR